MFCANCLNWDICAEHFNGRVGCDIDMSEDFGYVGEAAWYDEDGEIGEQYFPFDRGFSTN